MFEKLNKRLEENRKKLEEFDRMKPVFDKVREWAEPRRAGYEYSYERGKSLFSIACALEKYMSVKEEYTRSLEQSADDLNRQNNEKESRIFRKCEKITELEAEVDSLKIELRMLQLTVCPDPEEWECRSCGWKHGNVINPHYIAEKSSKNRDLILRHVDTKQLLPIMKSNVKRLTVNVTCPCCGYHEDYKHKY